VPAQQGHLTRFRAVRVSSAAVAAAPTDGQAGTAPQLVLSPKSPASGLPTMGFQIMLKAPTASPATAGVGGFSVTPWVRDPISFRWASGTASSIEYSQLFQTFDVDACELYFQIENVSGAGDVDIHVAEV
jgi:hypothetical protein